MILYFCLQHLQEAVIRLLVDIQKSFPSDIAAPYSASKCRKALYSVLVELVNQPCPTWPPPTNFALRLLRNGQNDTSPDVSLFCSAALNALTVIIHYQFSNGPYWTADNLNGHHERDVSEREEPMDVDLSSRDELMDVEQEATCDGVISIMEEGSFLFCTSRKLKITIYACICHYILISFCRLKRK